MADEIEVGARVVTSDGTELGTVKTVEEAAFLVNAPRQLDYWLQRAVARSATEDRVELSISSDDIGAYKMDNANDHNAFHEKLARNLDPNIVRGETLTRGQPPR
jgi:hypothetical protein